MAAEAGGDAFGRALQSRGFILSGISAPLEKTDLFFEFQ
jgi:hypothetical protein